MSNVKLLSCSKASAVGVSASYNPDRKKLLISGKSSGNGTYTLDGGGNLNIATGATVILEGYIGAATSASGVGLVEIT